MRPRFRLDTIPIAAIAAMMMATACADTAVPTGPIPPARASFAAGNAGGAFVKSITGLEPLLDATFNISDALQVSEFGQVVGTSVTNSPSRLRHGVIWDGSTFGHDLGTLSGFTESKANSISPDGSVIVGSSSAIINAFFVGRAVRWVKLNGAWTVDELPDPAGAEDCEAKDVANDGTIVGICDFGHVHVTVWRNGIAKDLGQGVGVAINRHGQIVVQLPGGTSEIWDVRTNPVTVTPIGSLGGNNTQAKDINDAGEVVGGSLNAANEFRPFLWTAKKGIVDLGTLGPGLFASVNAINNAGQIAGTVQLSGGAIHAAIWAKGKIVDLGVLPAYDRSDAVGLNNVGQIVGTSRSSASDDDVRATLWTLK